MGTIDRRRFLGTGVFGTSAGVALAAGGTQIAADERQLVGQKELPAPPRPPIVELGKTGMKVSRLAQGTGVNGKNRQSAQTRLGFEQIVALFRHAFDRGINFFDLADWYGTHIYFREALRSIPREDVTILTKIWWPFDGPMEQTHLDERRQDTRSTLERFRHELTTDYIDIVLLHCLRTHDWSMKMQPYMDILDEEKEAGRVRAVGVSCHDFGALKTAVASPWVDVILARINPHAVMMDASTEEVSNVLRTARQNGKAIIGMKIFGAGKLANKKEECMKFAQGAGLIDAMTIGFHKPEQIDDVLQLMAKYPAVIG